MDIREERTKRNLSQAKLTELTGIPQSILSSYELGKKAISQHHMELLVNIFQNSQEIQKLVSRKKRYSEHTYTKKFKESGKRTYAKTSGNEDYLKLLNTLYEKHIEPKKIYSAISLFSGIGGLSLGFSAAGTRILGYLEIEKKLREIYKANFSNSIEMGGDILSFTDVRIKELKNVIGNVDYIIGGPPCQGFSLSGKRDKTDPRNKLFKEYLRVVDIFRPKIFVIENVRLLTSMKNEDNNFVILDIIKAIDNIGYKTQYFEINAKDYGVPQHRERVLIIAYSNEITEKPSVPIITHGKIVDLFSNLSPERTFGDACSDLEYIESGEESLNDVFHKAVHHPDHVINWLWDVPEGMSAHDNEDVNLRPPSGYNTTYKRQIWNEPASTVQTTFGMISGCRNVHPIATRALTIREAARIQSFPDQYQLKGNNGAIRTGIGNAVPPLLAYNIALHLNDVLARYDKNSRL